MPPPPVGSADDVEAEFYEALRRGDLERLMATWADDDDIVCVHPGGQRLVGATAIRASFESIFGNGAIDASAESVRRVEGVVSSVHSLIERVKVRGEGGAEGVGFVVATNVYAKGPRGWRIVAHHASPASGALDDEVEPGGSTLH